MEEGTVTLVFKITLSSGEKRSHSYSDCPVSLDAFNKWWKEQMKSVFQEIGLRHWFILKNPTVYYHGDHIASMEFQHNGDETFEAMLEEKTDFQATITGSG